MPTKDLVTKVWIEPGCIVCDACENTAPTVFEVTDDTCIIRPAALDAEFTKPITQAIIDAAEECPVDVIKFELVRVEVSVEQAAAMEASAAASAPVAHAEQPSPHAPKPGALAAAPPKEVSKAAPAKAAPSKPAPAKVAEPTVAKAKTSPHEVSVAGASDPAIAALLRAASARGGAAVIQKREESLPPNIDAMKRRDPRELPPDARQAMIMEAAKRAKQQEGMGRRAFMGSAALTVGWVAFGVGAGVAAGPAFGRFMMPNVLEEPDPKVRVGKLQKYLEMQPGEVNEDFKPQGIWMIREEERIAALSIICTHLGCIPNWLPNDRKFKCPCHGSGYKPNGINFEGPTPRPLERFNITVEDGLVLVDKSKKYQWELGQWDQPGSFIQT